MEITFTVLLYVFTADFQLRILRLDCIGLYWVRFMPLRLDFTAQLPRALFVHAPPFLRRLPVPFTRYTVITLWIPVPHTRTDYVCVILTRCCYAFARFTATRLPVGELWFEHCAFCVALRRTLRSDSRVAVTPRCLFPFWFYAPHPAFAIHIPRLLLNTFVTFVVPVRWIYVHALRLLRCLLHAPAFAFGFITATTFVAVFWFGIPPLRFCTRTCVTRYGLRCVVRTGSFVTFTDSRWIARCCALWLRITRCSHTAPLRLITARCVCTLRCRCVVTLRYVCLLQTHVYVAVGADLTFDCVCSCVVRCRLRCSYTRYFVCWCVCLRCLPTFPRILIYVVYALFTFTFTTFVCRSTTVTHTTVVTVTTLVCLGEFPLRVVRCCHTDYVCYDFRCVYVTFTRCTPHPVTITLFHDFPHATFAAARCCILFCCCSFVRVLRYRLRYVCCSCYHVYFAILFVVLVTLHFVTCCLHCSLGTLEHSVDAGGTLLPLRCCLLIIVVCCWLLPCCYVVLLYIVCCYMLHCCLFYCLYIICYYLLVITYWWYIVPTCVILQLPLPRTTHTPFHSWLPFTRGFHTVSPVRVRYAPRVAALPLCVTLHTRYVWLRYVWMRCVAVYRTVVYCYRLLPRLLRAFVLHTGCGYHYPVTRLYIYVYRYRVWFRTHVTVRLHGYVAVLFTLLRLRWFWLVLLLVVICCSDALCCSAFCSWYIVVDAVPIVLVVARRFAAVYRCHTYVTRLPHALAVPAPGCTVYRLLPLHLACLPVVPRSFAVDFVAWITVAVTCPHTDSRFGYGSGFLPFARFAHTYSWFGLVHGYAVPGCSRCWLPRLYTVLPLPVCVSAFLPFRAVWFTAVLLGSAAFCAPAHAVAFTRLRLTYTRYTYTRFCGLVYGSVGFVAFAFADFVPACRSHVARLFTFGYVHAAFTTAPRLRLRSAPHSPGLVTFTVTHYLPRGSVTWLRLRSCHARLPHTVRLPRSFWITFTLRYVHRCLRCGFCVPFLRCGLRARLRTRRTRRLRFAHGLLRWLYYWLGSAVWFGLTHMPPRFAVGYTTVAITVCYPFCYRVYCTTVRTLPRLPDYLRLRTTLPFGSAVRFTFRRLVLDYATLPWLHCVLPHYHTTFCVRAAHAFIWLLTLHRFIRGLPTHTPPAAAVG